jgi:sulfoxide reductase heme-binding subunit YedZ
MQTSTLAPLSSWMPWSDRAGRLVILKLVIFLALLGPAVWMAAEYELGWLSPKPVGDLIKESGVWSIRMLVVSLAVTPARYVLRWNKLVLVRRMVGLAALYYTLLHILLWCIDLQFDAVMLFTELFLRTFLTVGLAGTLIMVALGVTSNDWSIRHLGAKRWNVVHAWVYAGAGLSLLHYFMEVRLDATEAALWTGVFFLLVAFRLVRKRAEPGLLNLSVMALVCGIATALAEATYYKISTNVNVMRVLSANLDFSYTIRPAWWVFGTGIVVAVLAAVRARFGPVTGRKALNPSRR